MASFVVVLADRSASIVKMRPNVDKLLFIKMPSCSVEAAGIVCGYFFDGCLIIICEGFG